MNIAIVGCGFVADYYLGTLALHPELKLLGVLDKQAERATTLAERYQTRRYRDLDELLGDERVELVVNLTDPRSHYAISHAALTAGKHVYSEKPLAMTFDDARALTELAAERGLEIGSAPCSLLGETAQTLWHALRAGAIGKVRLVYAEMDDGMVHKMPYRKWRSESGIPWPYKDEFEIGCTLEHAGYDLTWLAAWFGPAVSVTSFASVQIPDKLPDEPLDMDSPDFSVACIQFASGVVARLTCSIVAPHDHSLKIIGDEGVLYTNDSWDYHSPVYSRRLMSIRRKTFLNPVKKRHKLLQDKVVKINTRGAQNMDFSRGPAELASAIRERRRSRLGADFSLHVIEMALAIHYAREQGASYRMTTTFEPIEPMPWARGEAS
ncbi:MAG TPA: Gfo/Idh/MocA family oxidoreductase [Gammaproteobacteria bacterium]|nr:Gfo/Idh/MocA family oxidoreductase [Gammaproteobacteria bacterium]